MIAMCGLSQYSLGLFHLCGHAFFKAMLFLSSAAVIHAVYDQQDVRKMGGLLLLIPRTYSFILLGSLSLMAFPFMTGFYSKDLFLEFALVPRNATSSLVYLLTFIAALLSATYSARLLIFSFISKPHFPLSFLTYGIIEPSISMFLPLLILALGSAFFGYFAHNLFLDLGSSLYKNSLFTHPLNTSLLDSHFFHAPTLLKFLPLLSLLILLSVLPLVNAVSSKTLNLRGKTLAPLDVASAPLNAGTSSFYSYSGLLNHFNYFNYSAMSLSLSLGNLLFRYLDRGLLELFGPYGLSSYFSYFGFKLELLASGFLTHYALLIISSLLAALFFSLMHFLLPFLFFSLLLLP